MGDRLQRRTIRSIRLVGEVVPVSGSEAMKLSRELAQKEDIFVGTSHYRFDAPSASPPKQEKVDSVECQEGDRGGKIRAVLAERTGAVTIPQIFIGGEHVGGCTELFDMHCDGKMLRRLDAIGVDYRKDVEVDAYGLLPKWLHPRKAS